MQKHVLIVFTSILHILPMDLMTVISFVLAVNNNSCRLQNNYFNRLVEFQNHTYQLPFNTFLC